MSEGDPSPRGDGAGGDGSSSKFNTRNPAVKRILREQREMLASDEDENDWALHAEMCEDDIFEWHFAIMGAEGSEFEGGIYHGRILLPPEYPFKPPSFMLLTPSGRFETMTKICLSITQHHPEHWQPSWSVRTALLAVRAFMPTPADGAVGSLEFTADERRALAARSRSEVPNFGNAARRELTNAVHRRMLARWEARERERERERERGKEEQGEEEHEEEHEEQREERVEHEEREEQREEREEEAVEPKPRKVAVTEEEEEDDDDDDDEAGGGDVGVDGAPRDGVPREERAGADGTLRDTSGRTGALLEHPAPPPGDSPPGDSPPGDSPPGDSPPGRARVDSPAVADLKRKLDALAAALVAAIVAILIRKFVRSLGEGEL